MRQTFYFKMWQFYYKIWQLLQNATILLQNATVITKREVYYKYRQYTSEILAVKFIREFADSKFIN